MLMLVLPPLVLNFVDLDVPVGAWIGLARGDRRHAGDRPLPAPRRPRADADARLRSSRPSGWLCGLAFAGGRRRRVRRRRVRRVHQRLPDREVAQRRQRVRLVDAVHHAGDPAEVPAPRAVLGHLRRPRAARGLHRPRQRADQPLLVGAARVRRVPGLHRRQDHPPPRRRGRARSRPAVSACSRRIMPVTRRARRAQVLHHGSTPSVPPRRCSPRSS